MLLDYDEVYAWMLWEFGQLAAQAFKLAAENGKIKREEK